MYLLETRHRMQYNADAISAPDLSLPSIHGFRLLHSSYPLLYRPCYIRNSEFLTRHRWIYLRSAVRVCFFREANSVKARLLRRPCNDKQRSKLRPLKSHYAPRILQRIERLGSSCFSRELDEAGLRKFDQNNFNNWTLYLKKE